MMILLIIGLKILIMRMIFQTIFLKIIRNVIQKILTSNSCFYLDKRKINNDQTKILDFKYR